MTEKLPWIESLEEIRAEDQVQHPEHYTAGGIEVLDIFRAKLTPEEYRGCLKANVLKYLFRERHKGSALQDLKKAQQYLGWLIEHEEQAT